VPSQDSWIGLDVLVGTHGRSLDGQIRLRIRSADGRVVRESSAGLGKARDNDWLAFRYPVLTGVQMMRFTLEFALQARPGTLVSFFETTASESRVRRALRRLGLPLKGNTLYCRTWFST
jgi:hypothetical protein